MLNKKDKMEDNFAIKVEGVSKKYSKSLKHSMLYGIKDIARNTLGLRFHSYKLRKGEFWAVDDVLAIWYRDCSCNRVSDHIKNTVTANKLFLKKYYNDLKNYPKFCSLRMREIANAYCQLVNTKKGNDYFKLSLKCYPFNIKSIIGLILSFGGVHLYKKAFYIKSSIECIPIIKKYINCFS